MTSYQTALRACQWINEHSETHRVTNCKGDAAPGRMDYWLVTEFGNMDIRHGRFTNDAQLTTMARSQGWEK